MICNIRTIERGTKKVKCFKTKYKNIVICELDNRCYSITHYKTGIALSFNRYATKQEAIKSIARSIEMTRFMTKSPFCKDKIFLIITLIVYGKLNFVKWKK